MERFTRFVPAPVRHVFAFVTLIERIVAAIVLVFVAGGLLLSKVSDWPSYVVYQTTVLTIGVGAIAVMIAVLIGRGQVTVNVANSVSATAVAAANLPSAMFVGVRWARGYVGAEARAYCPDHDVMLLFKRNDNGEVERLTDSDAVSTEIHGGSTASGHTDSSFALTTATRWFSQSRAPSARRAAASRF